MKTLSTALGLGLLGAAATAQPAHRLFDEAAIRAFVSQRVASQTAELSRVDVQLGMPDAATFDAGSCRRSEAYVPGGARLWGRGFLGLRCTDGAAWSVRLPVTVTAWGPALVATRPLPAGTVPASADLREDEVELTREPGPILRDARELQGRTLTRAVQAGQPLRADALRPTPVLQAGDPVRLRIVGSGFAITGTGQAMSAAAEGQPARVRTDSGRILTGIAREGRQVDIAP